MTFTEYLNQPDPVYMPNVIITESDCDTVFTNVKGDISISLTINGKLYYYVTDTYNRLWTIDSDGNKKSRSCFSFQRTH